MLRKVLKLSYGNIAKVAADLVKFHQKKMNHHQVKVTCSRDHVTLSHKLLAALLHRGIAMHCVLLEKFTTIQLQ